MRTICCLLPGLALLLAPVQGAEESSRELLRDGLFEEEVNQDFKKAEAAYRRVAERYDEERRFAGLAIFRLAELTRKSGDQEEAGALYRRVVSEFADQQEIAQRAREQLGAGADTDVQMDGKNPLRATPGVAEAQELQRLRKMEHDSPDLLDGVGEDGWHPIHKAAASGWTNAIDYLLERKVKVDPRTTDAQQPLSSGFTPLHLAVIHGHLAVVDRLLAAEADPGTIVRLKPEDLPLPVQVTSRDKWGGWSPLHLAILYQRREIMSRLLEAKAPLTAGGPEVASYNVTRIGSSRGATSRQWSFEATPLILAIWRNDPVAYQTLIDHGADVNQAATENGETPLLAAIWQTPGMVARLLEDGAEVTDQFVFGRSALHWAIMHCPPPVIVRLIKEGADVNARVQMNRFSSEGHPSPIEGVLNWNFDADQRETLCLALLEAGAEPTPRALRGATSYSQFRLMKAFLQAGVDPNGIDENGYRPLHNVQHVQAARLLIEAGARLEVKSNDGVTPFGIIIERDDTPDSRALIDYFLEQGVDASVVPALLRAADSTLGNRPLLPYVMSKTVMVGKSNPKAIKLAFPANWEVIVGEDLVVPGTPAPRLQELLSLNFQELFKAPIQQGKSSSRNTAPVVVSDLIIYRSTGKGTLEEVARLADRRKWSGPAPDLQWGDIVLFRMNHKDNDKQQMPLNFYLGGLEPRTVTLQVGPWKHAVRIENTHQTVAGLDLKDHFNTRGELVDLSKIVLRRGDGPPTTVNLGQAHAPKKIRLLDGDVIEYSLKAQEDPDSPFAMAHMFFPDRPGATISHTKGRKFVLVERLHQASMPGGRDFSRVEIQRPGEDGVERIPMDLVAASRRLAAEEITADEAITFMSEAMLPGDIVVFPAKENVSWGDRAMRGSAARDGEIGSMINLVRPVSSKTSRPPLPGKTSVPTRSSGRRVVLPPSR